jgi:hypothetical protein
MLKSGWPKTNDSGAGHRLVDQATDDFCLRDAKGQAFVYVYVEQEIGRGAQPLAPRLRLKRY